MKHCLQTLPRLNVKSLLPNNPHHFPIISIGAGSIVNLGHSPACELAGFTVKVCTYTSDENIIFDIAVPSKEIVSILKELPINSYTLIQKPMGEYLSEAQAIVDLCEQRHIHGSINFQLRYAPYILALKDAISRGWLGDRITTIEIHVNVLMP
jgi:hypothetical protein